MTTLMFSELVRKKIALLIKKSYAWLSADSYSD